MATIEDDQRHTPGPGSPPLWNESFWFAFYDPREELGVTVRLGMYPNKREGNLYLFFVHRGEVVHSLIDMRAPLPAGRGRLGIGGMTVEWNSRWSASACATNTAPMRWTSLGRASARRIFIPPWDRHQARRQARPGRRGTSSTRAS
jgi:hypothetical protein